MARNTRGCRLLGPGPSRTRGSCPNSPVDPSFVVAMAGIYSRVNVPSNPFPLLLPSQNGFRLERVFFCDLGAVPRIP